MSRKNLLGPRKIKNNLSASRSVAAIKPYVLLNLFRFVAGFFNIFNIFNISSISFYISHILSNGIIYFVIYVDILAILI